MEEKAELLFKPGCKAGSEYCGECDTWIYWGVYEVPKCVPFGVKLEQDSVFPSELLRCQQCLEAEAQLKELREKVERLETELGVHKEILPNTTLGDRGLGLTHNQNRESELLEEFLSKKGNKKEREKGLKL